MVRGELQPAHIIWRNRPYFDTIGCEGGGGAPLCSAARAVMQTGEYDYAWNTHGAGRMRSCCG